jgi:hypothetical protein
MGKAIDGLLASSQCLSVILTKNQITNLYYENRMSKPKFCHFDRFSFDVRIER